MTTTPQTRQRGLHRAWIVAGVAFVAILGAAGFRATPGVLITPLQEEFGWSRGAISLAVSINLMLYGLTAPFAAALMERFGMRRVVTCALLLVAAGSGFTVLMNAPWQLLLCWGVLVGLGTGSMALVFAATLTDRWFVRHRGLVTGILTAGGATGQLVFLPVLAHLAAAQGWRWAAATVTAAALVVVPLVWFLLRDHPAEAGTTALGADPGAVASPPRTRTTGVAAHALTVLWRSARTRPFWLLVGGFAICGMSTNGLVGTHFIPAAHDHGMSEPTAAGLLALVGIFDVAGTIASGWLSDKVDSRILLGVYYALRGLSLMVLPSLFGATTEPSMLVFIVFYGLDWVATVPPTVALCRQVYGPDGAVVFGWVFASHQIGAAVAAVGAGLTRDHFGAYDLAWYAAGLLCLLAALMSVAVRTPKNARGRRLPAEPPSGDDAPRPGNVAEKASLEG
ncbi:MFS transporter [Streptosporangium carneum]|uniref:MFS transporter n=1 Tax=Streptosporangium carneum TaxID=47481 RepID=A0A9W6I6I8_9ACTN|nr:MFS transporter [Streptosporangium carneum]GLK12149.1 MFS transporter [Streptosporangium carneum]